MQVLLLIDLPAEQPYHRATVDAIEHAAQHIDDAVAVTTSTTDGIDIADLPGFSGVIVGPGSPYRDVLTVWSIVQTARERGVPLVGT